MFRFLDLFGFRRWTLETIQRIAKQLLIIASLLENHKSRIEALEKKLEEK